MRVQLTIAAQRILEFDDEEAYNAAVDALIEEMAQAGWDSVDVEDETELDDED